jgi:DNA processing protein
LDAGDAESLLTLAVAGVRYGGGQLRLSKDVRAHGLSALDAVYDRLAQDQRERLGQEVHDLRDRSVKVAVLGSEEYPGELARLRSAPAVLFYIGRSELLAQSFVGVCGSRGASHEGLRAARACGEVAAEHGLGVASGYAKGVDTAAHESVVSAGGSTVAVLPDGILRFRVRRELRDSWDPDRCVVVSQFAPSQPWTAGGAMTRNAVIYGMSLALVVVEAGETGGTVAAGAGALDNNRRVIALEFARDIPLGSKKLVSRGAMSIGNRHDLSVEFSDLTADNSSGNQLCIL